MPAASADKGVEDAAIFLMFTMANVGLPGTSGFIGEILTMTGVYQASTWAAFVAATGVILADKITDEQRQILENSGLNVLAALK